MSDFIEKDPTKNDHTSTNSSSDPTPAANDEPAKTGIQPGKIVKLTVPREDIGAEITPSQDLVGAPSVKIRKVTKEGWIQLHRASELTTRLLCYQPKPDAYDEEFYFVDGALRPAVQDAMHDVRVFVFYSVRAKAYGLWIVKVNPGLSWYESIEPLFSLPESFFATNEILIKPDKNNSRYRIRKRAANVATEWLAASTEELLGTAIGEDHFIRSSDHPLYVELAGGQEL